ncbi:BTAD domain-containing putative transcriptional regulator [Streptomyces sp. NPDC058290]|uniref:AfsR/SARP family transcriptional regulator n=1 Tax=Streptomyces sp. NPDC058290 TaxID=3346426 RepID=UPI0036E4F0DF
MKHQIVLGSLLTAESRRTSIGRLVDSVWGTTPPSTAGKQIRNAVSDLRNILAPSGAVITPVADGYQLDIGEARLDLHEFRRHLAQARTHLGHGRKPDAIVEFRAALSLWTGPMLSGIESATLQAQVAGVNEGRLSVAEECIDLELAQDRHKSLVCELAAWVAEYPLRERMVAQYVLALHRSGARARAFTVYEQARRNLAESLGLSPGPELLEVHQLMLREDTDAAAPAATPAARTAPSAPAVPFPGVSASAEPAVSTADAGAPAPDSLPFESGHFVGRTADVEVLLAEGTAPGARRVLSVDGMGGVGKTTLAVYVAHRVADRYPDGRIFLDLCGHTRHEDPLGHRAALRRLLVLSGLPEGELPDSVEALVQMWRGRTTGRRMLVVLDNAVGAEQIRLLLPAGDECLTLVTSRRRLTMTALSPTRVVSLDPLPREEGYALFCRLLGKRHPAPRPDEVSGILDHCGDLPLAVAAAAARLRRRPSWQLWHLAQRLADPALRLADLQTEHGGLEACFDASYRHLNAGQQRLLRLLGTAEGERTNVASTSLLAGLPPFVAEQMLESLVDEHLLFQPEPGQYRMHPLVKTYCAQLPGQDGTSGPQPERRGALSAEPLAA